MKTALVLQLAARACSPWITTAFTNDFLLLAFFLRIADKKLDQPSQKTRSTSDDDSEDIDDDKSFGLKFYGDGKPGRSAKQGQDDSKSPTAAPPSNAVPTVSGEPFTVEPNEGRYTRFATAPVDADAFEFKFEAKAASGVHIAFMTSNRVQVAPARDANCYEVVIGGLRNSQSMIHLGNQGASLITKPTYHFNSEAQFNAFWISLRGGLLTVGRGNVTGVQSFMTARVNPLIGRPTKLWVGFAAFDKPITFRYGEATRAVVSTVVDAEKESSPLIWMRKPFVVPANRGLYHAYSAATVKADDFDFVFQVQAISDVRIGFLKSDTKQTKASSDCYEIILGMVFAAFGCP
jgi:hypothetical protein